MGFQRAIRGVRGPRSDRREAHRSRRPRELTDSETLLRPPVPSDSALDAETLDVGATVEDARAPEPARLGSRELPLGADLVHALLRDSEDRGGRSFADQIVRHDMAVGGRARSTFGAV